MSMGNANNNNQTVVREVAKNAAIEAIRESGFGSYLGGLVQTGLSAAATAFAANPFLLAAAGATFMGGVYLVGKMLDVETTSATKEDPLMTKTWNTQTNSVTPYGPRRILYGKHIVFPDSLSPPSITTFSDSRSSYGFNMAITQGYATVDTNTIRASNARVDRANVHVIQPGDFFVERTNRFAAEKLAGVKSNNQCQNILFGAEDVRLKSSDARRVAEQAFLDQSRRLENFMGRAESSDGVTGLTVYLSFDGIERTSSERGISGAHAESYIEAFTQVIVFARRINEDDSRGPAFHFGNTWVRHISRNGGIGVSILPDNQFYDDLTDYNNETRRRRSLAIGEGGSAPDNPRTLSTVGQLFAPEYATSATGPKTLGTAGRWEIVIYSHHFPRLDYLAKNITRFYNRERGVTIDAVEWASSDEVIVEEDRSLGYLVRSEDVGKRIGDVIRNPSDLNESSANKLIQDDDVKKRINDTGMTILQLSLISRLTATSAVLTETPGDTGNIADQRISCVAQRMLPIYRSGAWTNDAEATSSIAWAFADVIRNNSYGLGLDDHHLDLDDLIAIDNYHASRNEYYNAVVERKQQIAQALANIAHRGYRVAIVHGDQFRMVLDKQVDIPKLIIYQQDIVFSQEDGAPGNNSRPVRMRLALPGERVTTSIHAQYYDENQSWKKLHAEVNSDAGNLRQTNVSYNDTQGFTDKEQLTNYLTYCIRARRYRTIFLDFTMEYKGFLLTPMDTVGLCDSLLPMSSTSALVTDYDEDNLLLYLDRKITVDDPSKQHYALLQKTDGSISNVSADLTARIPVVNPVNGSTRVTLARAPDFEINTDASTYRTRCIVGEDDPDDPKKRLYTKCKVATITPTKANFCKVEVFIDYDIVYESIQGE